MFLLLTALEKISFWGLADTKSKFNNETGNAIKIFVGNPPLSCKLEFGNATHVDLSNGCIS